MRGFSRAVLLLAIGSVASSAFAQADVLTQRNDNARSGVNSRETVLTTANVSPTSFGRLWNLYADGQIVAQPLYVSQLAVDTPSVKGAFNAIIVATMHNTVYAYDADKENRLPDGKTKPLWATWLGQPRAGGKDIDMWSTNDPEWGIVSTPVIDSAKATLWVVAWHNEAGVPRYRLHALNLADGSARTASVVIGGPPTEPTKPCNYAGGYNPCSQKQRAALLLNRGALYVAFGGDGNRGCVFVFDAQNLRQLAFWSVTPTGDNGGIWQSGHGPAADADGTVYLMSGNGSMDVPQGGKNYGQSFVKLKLDNGTLTVADYFAPCNAKFANTTDMDLGAGGPVLIPNSRLLVGGGKEGIIYLLSRDKLGQHVSGGDNATCDNPNIVQEFQATELHRHGAGTTYGHIHSSPIFWQAPDVARLYVWGENDRLKAYKFRNGKFVDLDKPATSIYQPPNGMPGGMLALSSNGTKAGSAIVWAIAPLNGDANTFRGVRGNVLALDARDVSRQLWTSELAGARDRLGLFAKYVPPTVAGGKVFVATYGDNEALRKWNPNESPNTRPANYYLTVYGLLPPAVEPKPVVNKDSDDITVVRARITEAVKLSTTDCSAASTGSVDCTALLEKKYAAPSVHTLIVPSGYDWAGCSLVRITTASKQGARDVTSGVGWYAAEATAGSQSMTSGRFVQPAMFKQVASAVLKVQAPAILDEFIAVAACTAGNGSLDRLFKPYMQFDNANDGNIYRNWDRSPNYRISRAVPAIDRRAEVLQP